MSRSNKKTKNRFGKWATAYDNTLGRSKRHQKLLDLVVESASIKKNDIVLDIGCGTGLLSLKLLKKADCFIQGIDSSPEMLSIFKNKIRKLKLSDKINCKLGDAENLDFNNATFDIIVSTVSLHHVKDKVPMIKKINRALKAGGKFILGDIDVDTSGRLTDAKRLLRILDYLKEEYILAMKEGGIKAFNRIYDGGKRHILNDGEYCISFKQWKEICRKAKFKKIVIKPLHNFERFKVLIATK
jgi:ubiquinone/menaquinone biosynthesis C-methylase UbiE